MHKEFQFLKKETVWHFPAYLQVLYHVSHERCETVCKIINMGACNYVNVLKCIIKSSCFEM